MAQIQRCILKGLISGVVQTRNMFTADLNVVAPDTGFIVWSGYLDAIYNQLTTLIAPIWSSTSLELQNRSGSVWETYDEQNYTHTGTGTGDALANLVAMVMVAKASGIRAVGRKFWSPLTEAAVLGNSLAAPAMVLLVAATVHYVSLYTTAGGSTLSPGIYVKAGVFRPFLSGQASALLGTIRRRKPGRGL